jgi:hypothetical protein
MAQGFHWIRGLNTKSKLLLSLCILFVMWLGNQLFGILAQELYVFADIIWKPFMAIGEFDPNNIQNENWVKPIAIVRFIIMLLAWGGIISFPFLAYSNFKYRIQRSATLDFEDEIKELVQVMEDSKSSQRKIEEHIKKLFDSIVKYVTGFYGQASEDVRATLFVSEDNNIKFTNFRWGWGTTPKQDAHDLYMILHLLNTGTSHAYWRNIRDQEMFKDGDKNTALLIRNIGVIRLGILFSFRNDIPDIEERTNEISKAILPFSLLGLIGQIPKTVLKYNREGGENAV